MARSWRIGVAALCLAGALLLAKSVRVANESAGPCVVAAGPARLGDLPEASGLAIGRRTPGIIWSHNDSGNAEVLYALDASGHMRGRVRVPVRMRDWEDVSAARCEAPRPASGQAGACLYIADIGDNGLARRRVQIYRVAEPAPSDAETVPPEVFQATYADGRHNAEAMFVIGTEMFIVTRDRTAGVYRAARADDDPHAVVFQRIGELGLEAVTDAEATPDERSVVVRTSGEVLLYRTADLIQGGRRAPYRRISIAGLREVQGEGVALDNNGTLYLASEGRPWSRAGTFMTLRCKLEK